MQTYDIDDNVVITMADNSFVLWNLTTGDQYQIVDRRYLDRLYELTTQIDNEYSPTDQDASLIEARILSIDQNGTPTLRSISNNTHWGWDLISKIFHYGTKHTAGGEAGSEGEGDEQGYLKFCKSIEHSAPVIEVEKSGPVTSLPEFAGQALHERSLKKALWERMTSRSFENTPVALPSVSDILYATFGKIHGDSHILTLAERGIKTVGYRRSSPSAGCLQASEAYLIALNVDGLDKGVYHYRSHTHELTKVATRANLEIERTLCYQSFAKEAAFLIVITSNFEKLWWKYPHSRAYRSALLDVGHLSQTFGLVAGAYGLDTWLTGYFVDDLLNELIAANGSTEHSIFVVAAGHGKSDPISPQILKEILGF